MAQTLVTLSLPLIQCPSCRGPLEDAAETIDHLDCHACGAVYPVHFGIPDLRCSRLEIAGACFDADRDLRQAGELDKVFTRTTYRDWFFSEVDSSVARITNERQRKLAERYFRDERQVFGIHGITVLEKMDAYLSKEEPVRRREWEATRRVALEAGCGGGQFIIGFADRFERVIVVDIAYESLIQARQIARDHRLTNVQLFAGNLEDLPLPDFGIDFYHCNGVLEHVAHPDRVVQEASRVLRESGIAFFLSPNRYSLYLEPHFRIPAFGFWPMPLRRWLSRRVSGVESLAGTELRSLAELYGYARRHFQHFRIYFLPRYMKSTARRGVLRNVVRRALSAPLLGRLLDLLLNRVLLAVVPYHVLLGFRR